jgi:sodium/potassium-transporting ATPase subunit beta
MAADDVDYAGGKGQKKGFGAKVRGCCRSIWNPQKKEFLGRTGCSWAKISLFYIVFYSCLAGFFAIMLVGFFSTLDPTKPTMQDMYSLIKQNPGMGFRPMKDKSTTLIKFNSSDVDTYSDHIQDILTFLKENKYLNGDLSVNTNESSDSEGKLLFGFDSLGQGCDLIRDDINSSFGFKDGKPCVLLKINRVINWAPKAFDNESLSEEFGQDATKALGGRMDPDYVGVSCEGENDADVDNLGTVDFYPNKGFKIDYFPYTNAEHYRAPIVFAKFTDAKIGSVIQIWCKLWVKNIKHHKNDKGGSVHFELLVDGPYKNV